jgi:hypothetical protein
VLGARCHLHIHAPDGRHLAEPAAARIGLVKSDTIIWLAEEVLRGFTY